jgi:hypothetical protein
LEVMGDIPDSQEPRRHPQWTPFGWSLDKDPESGVNGIAPVRVVWLTGQYLCMLESPVRICLSAGIISFVLCCLLCPSLLIIMGQAQVTPKTLLLSHFSEICAKGHIYGMEIKKGKFNTLCSAEWPTFKVDWPPQGTFSLDMIKKVRDVINRPSLHGHPDQYPYILMWQTLVEDPPSWLQPFSHESPADRPTILAMSGNTPIPVTSLKKPILQEEPILHPSLIDLHFEVNPPPCAAAAPLQSETAGPPEPPHSSASPSPDRGGDQAP